MTNVAATRTTSTDARKIADIIPSVDKTKRDKRIYWISTVIVCAVMVFAAVNFNLTNPVGPMKGAFAHLGFPDYFKIELSVAKILGVLALLIPGVPRTIKGFAYAGMTITLISASIAHYSSGDSIMFIVDPLIFLAVLAVSYFAQRRLSVVTGR